MKFKKSQRPQILDGYVKKFVDETWGKSDRLDLGVFDSLSVINYLKNLEDNPTWE